MVVTELLCLSMFIGSCFLLLAGFPVAFTLAGAGFFTAMIGYFVGHFDLSFFGALPSRIFRTSMFNEVLVAVPLFVFMGVMLERSRVAEDLLDAMGRLFGKMRGGLGISVTLVGALLAASTGIVGATVVTMGLISLPTMLKRGYCKQLASGTICAAGTLGQIIPPSIVLVLLGDQISNAYSDAQRALGNWAPDPVTVSDLFAGALLPGLSLIGLYIAWQFFVAWKSPHRSPAIFTEDNDKGTSTSLLQALIPPLILIIAVLGSILAGIATPTEAAAVGAVGAIMLAGIRLGNGNRAKPIYSGALALIIMLGLSQVFDLRLNRETTSIPDLIAIGLALIAMVLLLYGLLVSLMNVATLQIDDGHDSKRVLPEVMRSTMRISSMVFTILIGASIFSLVFRGLGGDDMVHLAFDNLPGGAFGAMVVVMLVMFLLGFFLDFIEITFVVVPIVAPVLLKMGLDPVWLGVMMAMNLQASFLTPPFGFSLFYLRGVAPDSVTTLDIYKGVAPFIVIQVLALIILAIWPTLATWLPGLINAA